MQVQLDDGRSFDLSVLPLNDLKPHEEIIPHLVDIILQDMGLTGIQRDPILVDKIGGLVLDGMHRRAALEKVGAKFAVCSLFDYNSENVKLARWLRSFSTDDPEVTEKMRKLFELEIASSGDAISAVDKGKSPLAVLCYKKSFVSRLKPNLELVNSRLALFDKFCAERGIAVESRDEKNHEVKGSWFIIYPMIIEKKDVRRLVGSNKVFPYKSTRHTVVLRPVNICFPLNLLQQDDIEKCQEKLKEILSSAHPQILEPGTPYNGRQYYEPIVIVVP